MKHLLLASTASVLVAMPSAYAKAAEAENQDAATETQQETTANDTDAPQVEAGAGETDNAPDLTGLNQKIETVSVYATRRPIPAFDYPGQVTVIERDRILDFNPSAIQDVFDAIPGAQFDDGPRRTGDAPSMRGIGTQGVLIFLDGARQNFVSGHDGRFFIDPELVRSIEVIRGPTSALYGSGAIGGVIAAQTITAQDVLDNGERFGLRLNSGYQSVNDEYEIGGTGVWQSEGGIVDVVGHLTYRNSGDIELGNDTTLPADDEIYSSLAKVTARPTSDLELFASYIRYDLDATDPSNPQGVNQPGRANELVFRDAESETAQGGLNWGPAGDLIDLRAVGYYTESAVEEDEVENPRTRDRAVETYGFTIDNRSIIRFSRTADLTFTYGGEYYKDEQTGRDTGTEDQTRGGVPDAQTEFLGAFVQAELRLKDLGPLPGEVSLIPAVRWDSFESSSEDDSFTIDQDELSPKVGLSYKPIPEVLIFGNYAEGFRAPSFNEAFADGAHFVIPNLSAPPGPFGPQFVTNLFIPNPDLQSETSETFEVGAGVDLDDVLFDGDTFIAKASYYQSDVNDLIGLDVNTPLGCFDPDLARFEPCGTGPAFNNTSQNVNITNAEIDGFEAEFGYEADYAFLRGNIATIDGKDADTGAFLEGFLYPTNLFLDGGMKLPQFGLRLGSRIRWAAEFDQVNEPQDVRDSYIVGDLYAVWEPKHIAILRGLRVDLGVDNVADSDFEVVNAGVSQPGRNVKIGISWGRNF